MRTRLSLLAGPDALALLRERGLRAEDVDVIPGASGGPKWLALAGLDRVLFGEFLRDRKRPLHLVGSSIGSWRFAAALQKDPAAALQRFEVAYLAQSYPRKPPPELVSQVSERILDELLGPTGADELLHHPWARLHVITARTRGPMSSEHPRLQLAGLALAAGANLLSRKTLGWFMERVVFHTAGDATPFANWTDLPTRHLALTKENLRSAILASGSIPLVLSGVKFEGGPQGVFRDGGVIDYHLDLDFGTGEGLVLYPHFYPYVVPGWFDKGLKWRRARAKNFRRTLVIAPSPELIDSLPGKKIPDRNDFATMSDAERLHAWRTVVEESNRMGDELRELIASGRLAERVQPFAVKAGRSRTNP